MITLTSDQMRAADIVSRPTVHLRLAGNLRALCGRCPDRVLPELREWDEHEHRVCRSCLRAAQQYPQYVTLRP